MVTLETSIIRALLYLYFKFLGLPTITTTPPINWKLGNANHFKLLHTPISDFNLKCQPLTYLTTPSAIRILSIDFPDLSPISDDII